MSSSSSKSETSSATQSNQEDNRVVADNGALVLGKGAGIQINDSFSDNVLNAFKETIQLVRDAGQVAVDSNSKVVDASQQTLAAVTTALERQQKGTTTTFTDMLPMILIAGVAVIVFWTIFRKAK
jgi:hypothetical protein